MLAFDALSLSGLGLLGLLVGCSDQGPCPGVLVGAKFEVHLADVTSKHIECPGPWGFVNGTVLDAQILDTSADDDNDCKVGLAAMSLADGSWALQRLPDRSRGNGLLYSANTISAAGCSARAEITVVCDSDACVSGAAQACACTTQLSFTITDPEAMCPSACYAAVASTVTRL